jgi:hypothetical protein
MEFLLAFSYAKYIKTWNTIRLMAAPITELLYGNIK